MQSVMLSTDCFEPTDFSLSTNTSPDFLRALVWQLSVVDMTNYRG
ncbi:hypothetical protein BN8_01606 [Fibrisoma limi BUZ 3]|uniref:Uncharacterized protein n=1 Tax=Fibrisoma limi BUZ 3 TaxID=1185876 RepID=I2GFB9_9BACT|nr:hypothetical protein BN8_01606 [Fibrisoma limi BUZ 3]